MKRVTGIRTCLATLNQVSVSQVQTCLCMGLCDGMGLLNVLSGQCSKVFNNEDSITGYDKGFLSHSTEVTGGDGWMGEVSMTKPDSEGFKKWLNSLQRTPDILSFTVLPLHDLVHDTKVRDNLLTAISQNVIDNGIEKNKTEQTPCGVSSPNLSPDCCPLLVGRGRLTVFVDRGFSIRGNGWAEPEGYVKLWRGNQYRPTGVLPMIHFGNVNTHHHLMLQVWEKDLNDDDHLGGYIINRQHGNHYHHCGLNHGTFSFSYTLTCDKHLTGPKCDHYAPIPN